MITVRMRIQQLYDKYSRGLVTFDVFNVKQVFDDFLRLESANQPHYPANAKTFRLMLKYLKQHLVEEDKFDHDCELCDNKCFGSCINHGDHEHHLCLFCLRDYGSLFSRTVTSIGAI